MESNRIDAVTFSKMFLAGAKRLEEKKDIINELNVFPVPDGDTGTNMNLTIVSAVNEVRNIETMNMQVLAKSISSGSLRGARGNSGVILSQLLRGFTKVIRDDEEIDIETFAKACQKAVETAYKAVMKPKEGTILTVARGAAEKALEICGEVDNFEEYFKQIIDYAQEVLDKTPDMLPVLKEAGVVDSGGQGLVEIFKGAYAYYINDDVELIFGEDEEKVESKEPEVIGYDTRLIIKLKEDKVKVIEEYENYLAGLVSGFSVDVSGNIVRVHVFAEDPGKVVSKALNYGDISEVSMIPCTEKVAIYGISDSEEVNACAAGAVGAEDSKVETSVNASSSVESVQAVASEPVKAEEVFKPIQPVAKPIPSKEIGFIAVSVGEGLTEIFKSLGCDAIITGGQTMNPSTEDLIKAVEEVDAKTVFILPNNKNIILAANQAQYLVEDKDVKVIPTKTIPQGITALINFMNESTAAENEAVMLEVIDKVKTGQVTFAVRDTVINGMEIHQGNIMGIGDAGILSVGSVVEDTAMEMLDKMIDDESELICVYYGEDVDEEIANDFVAAIENKYPDCDVEIHPGGQPIYYYIVSVE